MSWLERMLVWFSGYNPSLVSNETPKDREPIAKIGSTVLFASSVAAMNWGVAGWIYSDDATTETRLCIAAIAALTGAAMVVLFDRVFLFFVDTAAKGERVKLFVYGALRVVIIIAIGSISSQAIMPLVLGNDLIAQGLHMVEAAEKNRGSDLNTRYQVGEKQTALNSAAKEVKALQLAAANLPSDIKQRLLTAKSCWADYNRQKSALKEAGYSNSEARKKLARKASKCFHDTKSAETDRDSYLSGKRAQLDKAVSNKQAIETDLVETNTTIKAKIEHARQVESDSFNLKSPTVMWTLITSSPGALVKWSLISFLQLVCELLPLLQKWQAGQSNIGRQRACHNEVRREEIIERLEQRKHDFAVSSAVNATSRKAIDDALNDPDVRATFTQIFAAYLASFAPTEAVRAMMRDLEARHVDVVDFMHRYPRYAAIISQAWSKAIKDTSEILARGVRISPVSGVGCRPQYTGVKPEDESRKSRRRA